MDARLALGIFFFGFLLTTASAQDERTVMLKDGTQLGPGIVFAIPTISKNSMERGQTDATPLSIRELNDELRKTYFNQARMQSETPSTQKEEVIVLPLANEAQSGPSSFPIRQVLRVKQFNEFGRREYTIMGARGPETMLQGITHLTPTYARVQTLRDKDIAIRTWDQRIGTSTIPPDVLRKILHHELNMNSPEDRMRIYRFYLQSGRYIEARTELLDALAKFPDRLAEQKGLLFNLNRAVVTQMFNEVRVRLNAGQPKLVSLLLEAYIKDANATDDTAKENLFAAEKQLEDLKKDVTKLAEALIKIKADLAALPAADQELVRPLVTEMENEISYQSQGRFADYNVRARTEQTPDKRISLAIGGWTMGKGGGVENFEVAKSSIRVRSWVTEYLSSASSARREEILELLEKEEAGRPELVGKVIEALKPPLPLPQAVEGDPPGLYRMTLPESESSGSVEYSIQLPPEYDPLRKYPCIVALPGLGYPLDMPISFWCGGYSEETKERFGVAARYGYVVIVPKWYQGGQMQYNYTGAEHDRVLRCVRDAYRRLSIDTNRVFITGHFDGGAAAWDIALSHPDMWAGAIMISPSSEKFILMYGQNAAYVPTYTVWGSCDSSSFSENLGRTVDDYLKKPKFDAIGVSYNGRPRDPFFEELPRIIDWMQMSSHTRNPHPNEIDVEAARPGDRFFYWFEMKEFDPDKVVSPVRFVKRENKIDVKLQPAGTSILLSKYPAKEATVWFRPGFVAFGQTVTIQNKSSNKRSSFVFKGDTRVLLEDVRTRADRIEPFYDKLDVGR